MKRRIVSALCGSYLVLFIAWMVAPLVVVILFSFHSSASLTLPFQGFSLRWYRQLFDDSVVLAATQNSVIVGGAVALVSLVVGLLSALAITRGRGRASRGLLPPLIVPVMLPGLLIGVMLLMWFSSAGVQLSLVTVILAQTLYVLPYTVLVIRARLLDTDLSLEEAARDLGSTRLGSLARITLPLIAPALIGAAVLAFALSLDEFVITFFVIGNQSTLPMMVWSMLRTLQLTPEVNAISTLLMLLTAGLLVGAMGLYLIGAKRGRK